MDAEKQTAIKEPLVPTAYSLNRDSVKAGPPVDEIESTPAMLKKIMSLALFPIIGMVFHPAYIIYNTAAFKDYKDEQSALAIGGIVLSISLLSLGVTFNGALDTLIP